MNQDPVNPLRPRWRMLVLALPAAVLCLWIACKELVPRQGWDSGLGPVVPHDTFPGDCSLCHMGSDWHTLKQDFAFDHGKETGVVLNGAHADVSCLLCHNDRGPVQGFAAQGCAGCHSDPHRGQLGRNCADCHEEKTWQPNGVIQAHDRTRLPLIGAHAATPCFRCHPGAQVGNFAGASANCDECHAGEYTQSSFDHVAGGFTTGCERCHRPVAWVPAQFLHPPTFPLTNSHGGHSCSKCHQVGTFTGLSPACVSCHLPEYQATTSPPHIPSGFSTSCEQCHNTRAWGGGNFQHSARFPLTNGHSGRQCADCHQGNVFTGLSAACNSCHLADFNGASNPSHTAFNFPTTCEQCHNTSTWGDGTFTHRFPITSGAHRNMACSNCHVTGIGTTFECIQCHTHNQQETDGHHRGVNNYAWVSQRCYDCHPNGRH